MSTHETTAHRKTVFNTIGSGFRSLRTLSKPKYVLEHLSTDSRFTKGEKHNILVDYIEIGRNDNAYLQYGNDQKTVSRSHAAIVKDQQGFVLQQLSKVNETLLNGKPINYQWHLQHGDVIQLSSAGPKLKFIVPSEIGPISPTWDQVGELFKQMIKPYRNGMIVLSSVVLLAIFSFTGWEYYQENQLVKQFSALAEKDNEIIANIVDFESRQDSINKFLQTDLEEINSKIKKTSSDLNTLRTSTQSSIGRIRMEAQENSKATEERLRKEMEERLVASGGSLYEGIDQLSKDIYYLNVENGFIDRNTGEITIVSAGSCTGFLLSDGNFVTARHCVDFWAFGADEISLWANVLYNNPGLDGDSREPYTSIEAISNSGKTFNLTNKDFKMDRSRDMIEETDYDGQIISITSYPEMTTDYAVAQLNEAGVLEPDYELSIDIPTGQELIAGGYPRGKGYEDAYSLSEMTPLYLHEEKSHPGLREGFIHCSETTAPGNSGGPVIVKVNNEFKVIGILSGAEGAFEIDYTTGEVLRDQDGEKVRKDGVMLDRIVPLKYIQ